MKLRNSYAQKKEESYITIICIPTDDDYADYKSEAQIRQEEYNELLIAMKSKKNSDWYYLHQENRKEQEIRRDVFACVPYGDNFDVLIPFSVAGAW